MPDFITRPEVEAIATRALKSLPGSKIDPASVKKRGSTMNVLAVGVAGALVEEVQRRAYAKLAALTRKGARGSELDAVIAEQTFGEVVRLGAEPSVTTVEIARTAGTLPGGSIPAGTIAMGGTVEFSLDSAVPFSVGQKGPLRVNVTSRAAGTGTRVPAGGINAWKSAGDLFDSNFTVRSLEDTAGGEDPETDDEFVVRAETWVQAVRRGTLTAILFGATQDAKVRSAVVVESTDALGEPNGPVILYIADSFGQANEALCLRVIRKLREWRCGGIPVRVVGSVPSYQTIVLAPEYVDGFAIPTVQAQARALVLAAVNRTLPKKPMERSLIFAAMRATPGLVVPDTAVVLPVGDVVPLPGQTIRTRDDLISFK